MIGSGRIHAETSLRFCSHVSRPVGRRNHFDIGERRTRALIHVVVNPRVGNFDLVADVWQLLLLGDFVFNLVYAAAGVCLLGGMNGFLHLRLQLEVEFHAEIRAAGLLGAFGFFEISAINLRVVLDFTRFDET